MFCRSAAKQFVCTAGNVVAEFVGAESAPRTWTVPGRPGYDVTVDAREIVWVEKMPAGPAMRAFDKASGAVRVLTTDALGETTSAPMLTEDHVFWVFDNVRASGGRLAMLMSLRRNGLGTPKVVVPRTDVATRNVLFDAGDVYISSSGDYGVFRVRPASRTFVALYETLEREGGIHSLATTRDRVFWTLAHEEWSAGVTTRQLSLVAAPKSGSARPITMIRHVTAGGWPALVGADDQLYACTQSEVLRLVESPPPARFERVLDAPNLDACGILADGIVWQVGDSVFGVARGR